MEVKTITFVKKSEAPVATKTSKVADQCNDIIKGLAKLPQGESAVITLEGKTTQTFMQRLRAALEGSPYECYRVKQHVVISHKETASAKKSAK